MCRDHAVRASTTREEPANLESADTTVTDLDPEARFLVQEQRAIVNEALDRLPPRYRRLLVQHDMHEIGYDALARSEDASIGSVKKAVSRARQAMRHAYASAVEEHGINVATWPIVGAVVMRWRSLRSRMHEYATQFTNAVPAAGCLRAS